MKFLWHILHETSLNIFSLFSSLVKVSWFKIWTGKRNTRKNIIFASFFRSSFVLAEHTFSRWCISVFILLLPLLLFWCSNLCVIIRQFVKLLENEKPTRHFCWSKQRKMKSAGRKRAARVYGEIHQCFVWLIIRMKMFRASSCHAASGESPAKISSLSSWKMY